MIKSKFYLIRGDGVPIYVGFTNRSIKQRFSEHKADKDFNDYNRVTIEKIDEIDYEFTWDEDTLYKNANEVSVRESQLVLEYGTQDSYYQKAIGGGQVWTHEKWFVKTNKRNPKFTGMSGDEIQDYIQSERDAEVYMGSFVANMNSYEEQYMYSFIKSLTDSDNTYLKSFINHMYYNSREQYLNNFVAHMIPIEEQYLSSFVSKLSSVEEQYLRSFTRQIVDSEEEYLRNMVKHLLSDDDIILQYLTNFVTNMREPEEEYLRNFTTNLKGNIK